MDVTGKVRLLAVREFQGDNGSFFVHRFGDLASFGEFSVLLPARLDLQPGFEGVLKFTGKLASNKYGVQISDCVVEAIRAS